MGGDHQGVRGEAGVTLRRRGRTLGLPVLADAFASRKYQRFDDNRHRARRVEDGADVDIVELLEFETVDRDDRISDFHFLAIMDADQPADVAVAATIRAALKRLDLGRLLAK